MGNRIGSKQKEKEARKPSLRDFFSQSSQACPLLLTLLALSSPQHAFGATFQVTDPGDYSDHLKEAPRTGTLRDAIRRAQKTPGPHTIVIHTSQPIRLKSSLPPLSTTGLNIIGGGSSPAVIDGQKKYTFGSAPENLSIKNVTIQNFATQGFTGGTGSGGGGGGAALGGFSYLGPGQGPFTFSDMTFSNTGATGGNGGDGIANFTGKPAGSGDFVQGGGGGAGPAGNGGDGEKGNILANGSTNGGYGGGGGGGGGKPGQSMGAHGGTAKGFGGGGGASDLQAGNGSPIPSPNPDFPPKNVEYMGGKGASGSLSEGGSGGNFLTESPSLAIESAKNSLQGGGGGGAGHTLSLKTDISDGGSSNQPNGIYTLGGGGGGGGGTLSPKSGNGGSGGVYSGGGGGGSSIHLTSSGQGGKGGFGGGGGGAGAHSTSDGGLGGFGAGSGQTSTRSEALSYGGGGGGGAGLGGVFYIDSGITSTDAVSVIFKDCIFQNNYVQGGLGGTNGITQAESGSGIGRDVFMTAGSSLAVQMVNKDTTLDLDGDLGERSKGAIPLSSGGLKVSGLGRTLTLSNPVSHFSGKITVEKSVNLSITTDGNLGAPSNEINLEGGTLSFPTLATSRTVSISGPSSLSGVEFIHTGTIQDGQTPGVLKLNDSGTYSLNPPIANTFSGGTEISGGAIVKALKGDASLGEANGPLTFLSGNGAAAVEFSVDVDTKRPLNLLGKGTIRLNETDSSFSGPITGAGPLTIEGSNSVTIQAHPDTTYSGTFLSEHSNVTLVGSDPLGKKSTISLQKTEVLSLKEASLSNKIALQTPIEIDAKAGHSTLSGQIEGSSTITYSSSGGTLALSPILENSTFTGDLQLAKGSNLQASGKNPLGLGILRSEGGSLTFIGDGVYENSTIDLHDATSFYANAETLTVFGPNIHLQGNGDLNLYGPGEMQIKSSHNAHGNTSLNSGAILGLEGFNPISTGNLLIESGTIHLMGKEVSLENPIKLLPNGLATIQADLDSTSLFKGPISGDLSTKIDFQGPGVLQLNSSNEGFSGQFKILSGVVETSGESPLGIGLTTLEGGSLVLAHSGHYSNDFLIQTPSSLTAQKGTTSTLSGQFKSSNAPLILDGAGTMILEGNNTDYTGVIHLNNGLLQVSSGEHLGGASVQLDGGTLALTGSSTYQNPLRVLSGSMDISDSMNTWTGSLTGSQLHVKSKGGGTLVLAGNNSDFLKGFVLHSGTGLSVAKQSNLGYGPVALKGGFLAFTDSSQFKNPIELSGELATFKLQGATNSLTGQLTGFTPLIIEGTGDLILTQASHFSGPTTLSGGRLLVTGNNPVGKNTITLNGGILQTSGYTSFKNNVFLSQAVNEIAVDAGSTTAFTGVISGVGQLLFNSPEGNLVLSNNSYTGGTRLVEGNMITFGSSPLGTGPLSYEGGSLTFSKSGSYPNDFHLPQTQTMTLEPKSLSTITGVISGEGGLTFTGPGQTFLTSSKNTYKGGTVVSEGAVLSIDSDGALGEAGTPFTFFTGNGILALTSPVNFSNRTFHLEQDGILHLPHGVTTLSSPILGQGSLILTTDPGQKGMLSLKAPTQHLHTHLQGSDVQVSEKGTLGRGSVVFSKDGAGNTSTLHLMSSATYNNPLELVENGTIVSGLSTHNIFTETITGPGRLTLQGPGSFALTSDHSSFNGGLTLVDSSLDVLGSHQMGSGTVIIKGTSTLHLLGSDTFHQHFSFDSISTILTKENSFNTLNGLIDGPGGFILKGKGTLAVQGNSTYQGGTVLSEGTLQVSGSNPLGSGLFSFEGGYLELLGNTSFSGPIHVRANGVIKSDEPVETNFSGPISGIGALTIQTAGTVTLTGNNSYTGGTNLAKGSLKIKGQNPLGTGELIFKGGELHLTGNTNTSNEFFFLQSGTIYAEAGTDHLVSGNLTGAGHFNKTGPGSIRLTGNNTLTGPTHLLEGHLIVDGTHNSPITVSVRTVLSGTGHVNHLDVLGILKPGDAIGTLHAGSIVFEAGSIFRPLCMNNQTSMLQAAKISIDSLALLDPYLDPFLPHSYTVATGLIDPNQHFALGYSGTPLFPITVAYAPDSIILSVTQVPLSQVLPSGNLQKIGTCYEQLPISADLLSVQAVIHLLPLDVIPSAFAQFDPAFYNAVAYVEEAAAYRTRAIYTAHAQSRRFREDSLWAVWGTGFGESIHQHKLGKDKSESGYDDHLSGFVTGVDGWALDHLLVSGGFSYGHSSLHWNQATALSSVKSYTTFVGATWFDQMFSVDGYISYSYHKAEGSRKIYVSATNLITPPLNSPIPFDLFGQPIDRKLQQTSDANSGTFHVGGLYSHPWQWGLSLLSFVNLDYFVVSQNTFEEKGGGVLNMGLRSKTSDLLRPEIGVGIGFLGATYFDMNLFANATLSYVKEVRFSGRGTDTSFAGSHCLFKVYGLYPQQNLVSTSIEVGAANYYGFGLTLNYTGIFGSHFVDNGGQLEITYLF